MTKNSKNLKTIKKFKLQALFKKLLIFATKKQKTILLPLKTLE